MDYERGLTTLKTRLPQAAQTAFLAYETRLRENLQARDLYGDNETRRSERAEIIGGLNRLALAHLGLSFNDLCQGVPVRPPRPVGRRPDRRTLARERRKRREALLDAFTEGDLRLLCSDMGVDYDAVTTGASYTERLESIVGYFQRRDELDPFLDEVIERRPHLAWLRDSFAADPNA